MWRITAISATPSVTFQVNDTTTSAINIGWVAVTESTVNNQGIIIYPGAATANTGLGIDAQVSVPLPRRFHIRLSVADTDSMTSSVECQWLR